MNTRLLGFFVNSAVGVFWLTLLILFGSGVALADDQAVVNTNDAGPGSLRQAILDVHDGGAITFNLGESPVTITLTGGELAIAKSLIIAGPGADRLTISGNDSSRVFAIMAGTVTIADVTVSNGQVFGAPAAGGAIYNAGNLTLQRVILQASRAEGTGSAGAEAARGGGLFNAGSCVLDHTTVQGNQAQGARMVGLYGGKGEGGGIYSQGLLTVTNSSIQKNLARGGLATDRYGGTGMGGGVANAVSGTLTIQFSTINENQAAGGPSNDRYGGSGDGGGLHSAGSALMVESTVVSNTALGGSAPTYGGGGYGGGIYNTGAFSVTDGTVLGNIAQGAVATGEYCGAAEGGGILSRGSLIVVHSTIASNLAHGASGPVAGDADAGGISAIGALHITDSTLCNNQAIGGNGSSWTYGRVAGDADAGALYSFALSGAEQIVVNTTICDNQALGGQGNMGGDAAGGGIFGYYTLTVEASTVVANLAQGGASVGNGSGGDASGGGVYGIGSLTLRASTVSENAALAGGGPSGYADGGNAMGGGIGQGYKGAFHILDSTVFSNTARGGDSAQSRGGDALGGGYSDTYAGEEYTPTVRCLNSTFYANRALRGVSATQTGAGYGGGLRAGVALTELSFCTVASNVADDHGGGIFSMHVGDGQSPAIKNTILANNNALAGLEFSGTVQSRGHNLILDSSGGVLVTVGGANTDEGNLIGVNPKLGPLQDNGGPTWTCALAGDADPSPAIDAASSTAIDGDVVIADQRGAPRPSPPCRQHDIGAFEWQSLVCPVYLPLVLTDAQ